MKKLLFIFSILFFNMSFSMDNHRLILNLNTFELEQELNATQNDMLFNLDIENLAKLNNQQFESVQNSPFESDNENIKKYTCDICNKSFTASSSLARHKRAHSGVKPHVCDYEDCNKAFNQLSALIRHKRTHTGERPYVCPHEGCQKAFTTSNDLKKHKKTHTRYQPY